ncbi:hypothetical protein HELRODRAFT_169451 [Helobdella robusta]|uniref:Uncharacterized protein n=1 Tax=Helobdella robusta TaxID=6412 RepID=T1F1Y4_HELRO|nr:hypothetical protein HELRODRAFT_169451 [Helobdella robusta]ESO08576.1 hypothetical protein HELRODRAFT_169451 [Helobdella robusta]
MAKAYGKSRSLRITSIRKLKTFLLETGLQIIQICLNEEKLNQQAVYDETFEVRMKLIFFVQFFKLSILSVFMKIINKLQQQQQIIGHKKHPHLPTFSFPSTSSSTSSSSSSTTTSYGRFVTNQTQAANIKTPNGHAGSNQNSYNDSNYNSSNDSSNNNKSNVDSCHTKRDKDVNTHINANFSSTGNHSLNNIKSSSYNFAYKLNSASNNFENSKISHETNNDMKYLNSSNKTNPTESHLTNEERSKMLEPTEVTNKNHVSSTDNVNNKSISLPNSVPTGLDKYEFLAENNLKSNSQVHSDNKHTISNYKHQETNDKIISNNNTPKSEHCSNVVNLINKHHPNNTLANCMNSSNQRTSGMNLSSTSTVSLQTLQLNERHSTTTLLATSSTISSTTSSTTSSLVTSSTTSSSKLNKKQQLYERLVRAEEIKNRIKKRMKRSAEVFEDDGISRCKSHSDDDDNSSTADSDGEIKRKRHKTDNAAQLKRTHDNIWSHVENVSDSDDNDENEEEDETNDRCSYKNLLNSALPQLTYYINLENNGKVKNECNDMEKDREEEEEDDDGNNGDDGGDEKRGEMKTIQNKNCSVNNNNNTIISNNDNDDDGNNNNNNNNSDSNNNNNNNINNHFQNLSPVSTATTHYTTASQQTTADSLHGTSVGNVRLVENITTETSSSTLETLLSTSSSNSLPFLLSSSSSSAASLSTAATAEATAATTKATAAVATSSSVHATNTSINVQYNIIPKAEIDDYDQYHLYYARSNNKQSDTKRSYIEELYGISDQNKFSTSKTHHFDSNSGNFCLTSRNDNSYNAVDNDVYYFTSNERRENDNIAEQRQTNTAIYDKGGAIENIETIFQRCNNNKHVNKLIATGSKKTNNYTTNINANHVTSNNADSLQALADTACLYNSLKMELTKVCNDLLKSTLIERALRKRVKLLNERKNEIIALLWLQSGHDNSAYEVQDDEEDGDNDNRHSDNQVVISNIIKTHTNNYNINKNINNSISPNFNYVNLIHVDDFNKRLKLLNQTNINGILVNKRDNNNNLSFQHTTNISNNDNITTITSMERINSIEHTNVHYKEIITNHSDNYIKSINLSTKRNNIINNNINNTIDVSNTTNTNQTSVVDDVNLARKYPDPPPAHTHKYKTEVYTRLDEVRLLEAHVNKTSFNGCSYYARRIIKN